MKSPRRLSILLAEDTPELQALILSWLEEAGHEVVRASSGRQIAELVPQHRFDLIVTDILMPDGDGWDAIAEVHRLRPTMRILAISGGAREMPASAVLRVARGAGAIGQLAKPFSRLDCLTAIARVMAEERASETEKTDQARGDTKTRLTPASAKSPRRASGAFDASADARRSRRPAR